MKKIITTVLAAVMLTGNAAFAKDYAQSFWDVSKDHWAFEYIADLADRGVIDGYDDGSFKPERTVSRAEWAKIMVDAAGVTVNDNSVNFNDMSNHWANKYVNAAKNYLTGYTDGSYRPDQAAVREDVTVAMVKLKGYDLSDVDYSVLNDFTDTDSISNYAKKYVAVAVEKDLINGFDDETFRGQATLTRAEAATLLYRAFQKGSDNKVTDVSQAGNTATTASTQKATSQSTAETSSSSAAAKPTAKPASAPTEAPKPYIMKKLASANLESAGSSSTYDYHDSIYYIDKGDSCIYKISVSSGSKSKFLDTSSLSYAVTEEKEVETVEDTTETVTKTVETGEFEEVEEEVTETVVDEETGEETEVKKTVTKKVPITKEVTEEVPKTVTKTSTETITTEEYNSYVPTQVYYDKENDRLLLLGYYTSYTKAYSTPSNVKKTALYDITNKSPKFLAKLPDYFAEYRGDATIQSSIDKSRMVLYFSSYSRSYGEIVDIETKQSTRIDMPFGDISGLNYGSNLYSILSTHIRKYNFTADKDEALSDWIDYSAFGIKDDCYYFWQKGGDIFKVSVRNGATTNLDINTNSENVEFADMGNMNNIAKKFYVADDDTLIFYDSSMQAFRTLTKNK